jgi:hypothetical protein
MYYGFLCDVGKPVSKIEKILFLLNKGPFLTQIADMFTLYTLALYNVHSIVVHILCVGTSVRLFSIFRHWVIRLKYLEQNENTNTSH